jgi:hypothetical protein
MKDSFALIKLRERPRPMPALLLFTLLYFNIFKLNACGSSTTSVKFYGPNPEGGLKTTHLFHA